MYYLSQHEQRLIAANEAERLLLRANSDGMLDPQVLLVAAFPEHRLGNVVQVEPLGCGRRLSRRALSEHD